MVSIKAQTKAVNIKLIETSLNSLSIEEKEKLYKVKGLLDKETLGKILIETENAVLERVAKVEEEKSAKARADSLAKEIADAEAAARAKADNMEKNRMSRGDGKAGRLLDGGDAIEEGGNGTPADDADVQASSKSVSATESITSAPANHRTSLVPSIQSTHSAPMEWDADAGRVVEVCCLRC
jgi:hypothetical protein